MMKTFSHALPALMILLMLVPGFGLAQEDDSSDYSKWVGREPTEMPKLLSNFRESCQRRYQSSIEKFKKPYDVATKWNQDHCRCIERFFVAKDDTTYVQIVNLELRDGLKSLPPLPPELEIYLVSYEKVQADCEKNPAHVTQAEIDARVDAEAARREALRSKNNLRKKDRSKPRLPYRPQKTPPGDIDPEARR